VPLRTRTEFSPAVAANWDYRGGTLDLLAAPAVSPTRGFYDECMKAESVQFPLGFIKPSTVWPFGSLSSFGAPGSGGPID
jgi:hypothetical protein